MFFLLNDTATTDIYTSLHTLSLHDALPIYRLSHRRGQYSGAPVHAGRLRRLYDQRRRRRHRRGRDQPEPASDAQPELFVERSEEHTSELQSLMRISYAVFRLKKKK